MHTSRLAVGIALAFAALPAAVVAQGFSQLAPTYRVTGVTHTFNGTAAPCVDAVIDGTYSFGTAGPDSWSWSLQGDTVCAGATAPAVTPFSKSGPGTGTATYDVEPSGEIRLEAPQLSHGAMLRASGEAMVVGPADMQDPAATLLAVELSSGRVTSDLVGPYHVMRLVYDYSTNSLVVSAELGFRIFDGAGGWNEFGDRWTIPGTTSTSYPSPPATLLTGTYLVQPDGTLDMDGGASNGVISPSGELATWTTRVGDVVAWTVALRQGTRRSSQDLRGRWGMSACGLAVDPAAPTVNYTYTLFGDLIAQALTPTTGTWDLYSIDFDLPSPTSGNYTSVSGGFAVTSNPSAPAGRFEFPWIGSTPLADPARGAVSSEGNYHFFVLVSADDILFEVGVRKVRPPTAYGFPTTATTTPVLTTDGGFSFLGNLGFRLEAAAASPGQLCAFVLGTQDAPAGLPLVGGTLWVQPTGAALTFAVASPAGNASMALPLPAIANLGGSAVFAQFLSVAPPASIAMSSGLRIELEL